MPSFNPHSHLIQAMALNTIEITLVVENETPPDLIAEHGFAAWIETGGECFLFDTGQGTALEHNARVLDIDLGKAAMLILSHGHYDHTGGIPAFLVANAHAPVIYGKGATTCRYSCHPEQAPRQSGIVPAVLQELDALPAGRRIELDAHRYLRPCIGVTGPVPRITPFENTGGPFYLDANKARPDLINDDLSLWFETTEGLVILTGCCHSGLINTISHIRRISGIERVHGIIGGLHLLNAGEERLQATRKFLAECRPDFLIPCHCTGALVAERLQREFGEAMVTPGRAGQKITIGALRPEG